MQEQPSYGPSEIARELSLEAAGMGWLAEILYDRKGFEPQPGVVYVSTCHSAKGLEWDTVYVAALTRAEFPAMVQDKFRSEFWFLEEAQANPEALALAELDRLTRGDSADDLDPVMKARLEQIGERLRLFYVAITRAKENLLLSCHMKDSRDKKAHPTLAYQHLKQIVDGRR
jgi:DNA helicase-2/ATP-dependent DNA helicase PcrA